MLRASTMSSETSTELPGLRPWHYFVLATLLAATAAVFIIRAPQPAVLVLVVLALASAGLAGLAAFRMLWPLAVPDLYEASEPLGERTRASLEREKALVLRSIKELEFDRAMGKVSDADFEEMSGRLRERAIGLMKQLDANISPYRTLVEQELELRFRRVGLSLGRPERYEAPGDAGRAAVTRDRGEAVMPEPAEYGVPGHAAGAAVKGQPGRLGIECPACGTQNDPDARFCKACGGLAQPQRATSLTCEHCGTTNDLDARFCKQCGGRVV